MNIEPSEQLTVDPKDLECGICYLRYTPITNEPLTILPCEHPICSSCFKNIKGTCPFCKAEILQNPIKNTLLSSLLERDSQVKKCPVHKQPMDYYCKEDYKLACSHCIIKKSPEKFGPITEIYSKMEEKKKAFQKLQNEKDQLVKSINEKISKTAQSLKRKLDDLFDEKLADHFEKQKRLKSSLDVIMFTEKEQYEHQLGLSKYEEDYKRLENWENSPDEDVIERIFKASSISIKQATQFYIEESKQIFRSFAELEKIIEEIIVDPESNSLEIISEYLHEKNRLDPKYQQKFAREYLLNTFKEHGIIANFQEKEDCFELKDDILGISKIKKFYPDLFKCCIEKLNLSCSFISDAKFRVFCEILQNVQSLSSLNFSLSGSSAKRLELVSNLVLSSKTLKNVSFCVTLLFGIEQSFQTHIQKVLNSERVSAFSLGFTLYDYLDLYDFHQDLVLFPFQTKKPIEEFTAKFLGNSSSLYDQIFHIISNALHKTTALRKVNISFGDCVNYPLFLQELCQILRKSHSLQELDLGFANVGLFKFYLGHQIFQIIRNSKELKKVSLFLAGNAVLNNWFCVKKGEISAGNKLEEFSLTIMECDDVDLDDIFDFLKSFTQLKKLILRIYRAFIHFQMILDFLENIVQIKSLGSLEFVCRDLGRLTAKKKKDLEVCKYRLSLSNIQHKIVFEELRSEHLPDYITFVPQEEDNDDDDDDSEDEENDEGNDGNEESGFVIELVEEKIEDSERGNPIEIVDLSEEEEVRHEEKIERKRAFKSARRW